MSCYDSGATQQGTAGMQLLDHHSLFELRMCSRCTMMQAVAWWVGGQLHGGLVGSCLVGWRAAAWWIGGQLPGGLVGSCIVGRLVIGSYSAMSGSSAPYSACCHCGAGVRHAHTAVLLVLPAMTVDGYQMLFVVSACCSIWTVDLAHLLARHGVTVSFCTITIGINRDFMNESFYMENMEDDERRVQQLFLDATQAGRPSQQCVSQWQLQCFRCA